MAKQRRRASTGMVQDATIGRRAVDVILHLAVIILAIVCVLPMWHTVMSSLSDPFELLAHKGFVLYPLGGVTLEGYKLIFRDASILKGYGNTIYYTVATTGMTSFNHYAYGSVGEWLYGQLCGIRAAEPGYRKSVIAPKPIEGLSWAEASLETPYGTLSSRWERTGNRYEIRVTVPVNTTAKVILPGSSEAHELGSGSYQF